ncbi:hypothetical protein [Labedaea rhizosphaerae]|uniref:MalT-like TPR region domain-containing protein n=1 Tax=Labedaea rhizosphaerae TaxID=598644 RepID=A0A4R6RQT0_LABRH|nr:hypothetical protein [Labedaea rhizosphaerae]TDP89062.1 hypothetical protein EV186_1159 [Labedaea rhizosphaerae]
MSNPVAELLDRADAARAAGRGDEAARLYDTAITSCREAGDLAGWTRAALGAASVYTFGTRCAERTAEPELLADCLDAALAARWGPDDLAARDELAARLDEVAAHVTDPDTRLRAHLWGLQVACETLALPTIHRHMRALERLGEESPRARFFAASRRLMLDLLRGRTDTAEHLIAMATTASERAALPDAWMVVEAMKGYAALHRGDAGRCASIAAECETFALAEGATAVAAEAAFLWVGAGRLDRARTVVHLFHGRVLDELPRDVNWLLTLQCLLEAALAVDDRDIVANAAGLLTPYAGRAVINAGAVMFHGLTDDTLARAAAVLGDLDTAARLRAQALTAYERLGATWWQQRLLAWTPPTPAPVTRGARVHLHPAADGLWLIGPEPAAVPVRALRGYTYLRELLRRPGRPVSCLDLVTEGQPSVEQPAVGETLDRQALQAYRQRLRDLEDDLAQAEDWSDAGRIETLSAERDALLHELTAAVGLGGRPRTSGSSGERARIAATKAISAAIARISTLDEPLGHHLRTTVHTGTQCSYQPGPGDDTQWILTAES